MGRKYRMSWRTFEGPVKAVIRFYCTHQDVMPDEMSSASFSAWCACESAMQDLEEIEQEMVLDAFLPDDQWRKNQKTPAEHQNAVIRKVCRLVAENMGLCDKGV